MTTYVIVDHRSRVGERSCTRRFRGIMAVGGRKWPPTAALTPGGSVASKSELWQKLKYAKESGAPVVLE